jgi:hypothetical protein
MSIESIALRYGRICAGFRAPTLDDDRTAILSVAIEGLFGAAAADAQLHLLFLGLRTRCARPRASGRRYFLSWLVRQRTYVIFWWDGESDEVRFLRDLSDVVGDDARRKPEALLILDKNRLGLRALLMF